MKERYLVLIIVVLLLIGAVSYKLNSDPVTGFVATDKSVSVNLTFVGIAGINIADDTIALGSGYYNGSCSLDYGLINSNGTKVCWVNTSNFVENYHTLVNNGTTTLNVTVAFTNLTDAEELFCGTQQGCYASNTAEIIVRTTNNETGSCVGMANDWALTNSTNSTVGACDAFGYPENSDAINVYVELHVPKDAVVGTKTLVMNYEAISL